MNYEYELIDRFLRNNLDDDVYAEYSAALDSLTTHAQPVREALKKRELPECNNGAANSTYFRALGWNEAIDAMRAAQPSEPKAETVNQALLDALKDLVFASDGMGWDSAIQSARTVIEAAEQEAGK